MTVTLITGRRVVGGIGLQFGERRLHGAEVGPPRSPGDGTQASRVDIGLEPHGTARDFLYLSKNGRRPFDGCTRVDSSPP